MSNTCYVYAIVPASEVGVPPEGLDGYPVTLEREGTLAAVISALPGEEYEPGNIEARTADIDWLGPRAAAHDRIVTWASDHGPAVPLPMFSLYRGAEGVRAMLRDRRDQLARALERAARGREFALRVYRDDDALRAALPDLRPEFAERLRAIEAASPGQRYLLQRKLDRDIADALRDAAREIASDLFERLKGLAVDALREPPPKRAGDPAQVPLALNAYFLVAPERYDAFRAELTALIERFATRGFRFDFTGPWPAYHFVGPHHDAE